MTDTIKANSVVALDYTLRDDAGEVLDTSEGAEPLHYLHGHGNIVPGLEQALTGRKSGESLDVVVPPAEGYGERDPEGVLDVPRDRIPGEIDLKAGVVLGMQSPDGHTMPVTVVAVSEEVVKLDANHELAGKTLHFSVTVRDIREATGEELSHGHVHGPGGHH